MPDIDSYLKEEVMKQIGMTEHKKKERESVGGYIYRIVKDDFDRREFKFCQKMVAVKAYKDFMVNDPIDHESLATISMQHKMADKRH